MKKTLYPLVSLLVLFSGVPYAHDDVGEVVPLDHLIAKYSEVNGTKFVLDPRVRAKVNLVGFKLEEITQTNLIDILLIHNFIAYEKEGVVYVLPRAAADSISSQIGEIWGSQ